MNRRMRIEMTFAMIVLVGLGFMLGFATSNHLWAEATHREVMATYERVITNYDKAIETYERRGKEPNP